MLSSMTPTIVRKDGKVLLITGSPGGRTIINTVLCIVTNVIDFKMSVRDAVDAPRLHHQWFPDTVRAEPALFAERPMLREQLQSLGHSFSKPARQGDAHSIYIDPATKRITAAADRRISGKAAGY
jgi:gamma-glutamyltranspeptidase/glutathione hydrolase